MSKIYVDEILPKDNAKITAADLQLPAGSVVQTVYLKNTTQGITVSTNGSYSDTGMSVSITPKYSNSKILVSFECHFVISSNAGGFKLGVFRDGVGLETQDANYANYYRDDSNGGQTFTFRGWTPIIAYDTAGTTSQITYNIHANLHNGSVGLNNGGVSYFTVQEIAQ